jgi:hypothetical protein
MFIYYDSLTNIYISNSQNKLSECVLFIWGFLKINCTEIIKLFIYYCNSLDIIILLSSNVLLFITMKPYNDCFMHQKTAKQWKNSVYTSLINMDVMIAGQLSNSV